MVDTTCSSGSVRLIQKLIELRKENWSVRRTGRGSRLSPASSWADEYKRIFKLFEDNLKK